MRKPLTVVAIATILTFNMAGIALAGPVNRAGGIIASVKNQVVTQNAVIINPATAVSGPAIGIGVSVAPVVAIGVPGGNATGSNNGYAFGAAFSESDLANIPVNEIIQKRFH
jgi:hypothetical protein